MERKKHAHIYLNLRNLCVYLWTGSHTSLQVVFQTASHSQAPPCLCSCYSPTWCYLFFLWALCVLSLSWRLHACILISVKSSLLPFNKYPAALLLLTSVDCYINLYQTCVLCILILLNVFSSPYWDQALWNQTIFHFP